MITLFIPYVNRRDLLDKALKSIATTSVQPVVLNNSSESLGMLYERRPPVPLSFSQTQQWMLNLATEWEIPFYLWMHNDAEAVGDTVLRLKAMADAFTTQKRKWGVIFTAYDALAAFNTEAMTAVGGWDDLFPWYFADNTMYRKLRLAGYECIESGLPVKHEPSQTIKSDPELNFRNSLTFPFYEELYKKYWGGPPGREIFVTPFGR